MCFKSKKFSEQQPRKQKYKKQIGFKLNGYEKRFAIEKQDSTEEFKHKGKKLEK